MHHIPEHLLYPIHDLTFQRTPQQVLVLLDTQACAIAARKASLWTRLEELTLPIDRLIARSPHSTPPNSAQQLLDMVREDAGIIFAEALDATAAEALNLVDALLVCEHERREIGYLRDAFAGEAEQLRPMVVPYSVLYAAMAGPPPSSVKRFIAQEDMQDYTQPVMRHSQRRGLQPSVGDFALGYSPQAAVTLSEICLRATSSRKSNE